MYSKSLISLVLLMISTSSMASIVNFSITTDNDPGSILWFLDDDSLTTIESDSYTSGDENTEFNYDWDLDEGDYTLTIVDRTPVLELDTTLEIELVPLELNPLHIWEEVNVFEFTVIASNANIPEPSILFLLGFGLLGLSFSRKK